MRERIAGRATHSRVGGVARHGEMAFCLTVVFLQQVIAKGPVGTLPRIATQQEVLRLQPERPATPRHGRTAVDEQPGMAKLNFRLTAAPVFLVFVRMSRIVWILQILAI